MDPTVDFLAAAIRIATPLLLAALGEMLTERSGVLNLSVEGAMLAGCLASALGAHWSGSPYFGLATGALGGLAVATVFSLVAIRGRVDQVIVGTALTLGTIGVTGLWYRWAFGAEGLGLTLPTVVWTPTVIAGALVVTVSVLLRSTIGLRLRAVGESAVVARAIGIGVERYRAAATAVGGLLAGLGGATLVLGQVGTFAERMTAGRGFIAIAIVVLGRWHPIGVMLAAVGFGALTALQFAFQAVGIALPYQLFLMLPYLVALAALAGFGWRARAPADLGRSLS